MPFQKGQSGNLAGRPPHTAEDQRHAVLVEHFNAAAEARVVKAIIRAAQRGNVRAANWLWEHKYGKNNEAVPSPSTIHVVYGEHRNPARPVQVDYHDYHASPTTLDGMPDPDALAGDDPPPWTLGERLT